jgi:hypothetical protein
MAMNLIQFQHGLSLPSFLKQLQCEAALKIARWSNSFQCPRCGQSEHSLKNEVNGCYLLFWKLWLGRPRNPYLTAI